MENFPIIIDLKKHNRLILLPETISKKKLKRVLKTWVNIPKKLKPTIKKNRILKSSPKRTDPHKDLTDQCYLKYIQQQKIYLSSNFSRTETSPSFINRKVNERPQYNSYFLPDWIVRNCGLRLHARCNFGWYLIAPK